MKADASVGLIGFSEIPSLIEAAFDSARSKGSSDWKIMTTAVLKNRILQQTGRPLDEETLGFKTFSELLGQFPDVVRLNLKTRPVTAQFVGHLKSANLPVLSPGSRSRVRSDIWRAILDYSAGHPWVWDERLGEAVPGSGDGKVLRMPTRSKQDVTALRREFAEHLVKSDTLTRDESVKVERWSEEALSTAALPPRLRPLWNQRLTDEVAAVASQWFREMELPVPDDLVQGLQTHGQQIIDDELVLLRRLASDCIKLMTLDELSSLNLPLRSLLRAIDFSR